MNRQSVLLRLLRERAAVGKRRMSPALAGRLLEIPEEAAFDLLMSLATDESGPVELRLEVVCSQGETSDGCATTLDLTDAFKDSRGAPVLRQCIGCGAEFTYPIERTFFVFRYAGDVGGGDETMLSSPRPSEVVQAPNGSPQPFAALAPSRQEQIREWVGHVKDLANSKAAEKVGDVVVKGVEKGGEVAAAATTGTLHLVRATVVATLGVVGTSAAACIGWGPPTVLLPWLHSILPAVFPATVPSNDAPTTEGAAPRSVPAPAPP